jgi:hypothetical protein
MIPQRLDLNDYPDSSQALMHPIFAIYAKVKEKYATIVQIHMRNAVNRIRYIL